MFGSKDLLFSSEKYGVAKSLRFRSSASAYLSRTPASASSDAKKFSFSWWTKKAKVATANQFVYGCGSSGSDETYFGFNSSDKFEYLEYTSSAYQINLSTTPVYRDPSAWYHCLLVLDTTQSTSTDRVKFFVNGVQQTLTGTFPGLNYATSNVNSTDAQNINRLPTSGAVNFDGYYAEVYMIDGQAKTTTDFGFYDNNGIWQPQGYTGTYGTNGFYLKFTDVGATSGANSGYGKDFSGFNTNYWTTNNFGTTSTATTYDSMLDSPVNYADGGNGRGNYAVLNPIRAGALTGDSSAPVVVNGNLTANLPSAGYGYYLSTISAPSTGYWYAEFKMTSGTYNGANNHAIGLLSASNTTSLTGQYLGSQASTYGYLDGDRTTGSFRNAGTTAQSVAGYQVGDTIMIAFGNGKLWWGKNGTWLGTGSPDPATATSPAYSGLTGDYFIVAQNYASPYGYVMDANFGQRPFTYTPPSGFSALNTQNLSTPTITNGAAYMAAVLYTGTGSSQTITASSTNSGNNPNGTTFQPDLVWVKGRSGATDHALYDAVRGVQLQLESNTTTAETTETTGLTAFTSSGFTTGALAQMNTNTATYVAWEWNAGGSNATNTTGTIQSTVRANTSAGFSIVTYPGNGTLGATVGHGLGVTPSMIIFKTRTNGAVNWAVYHTSIGNTTALSLNLTNATFTPSTAYFNNTSPDSSKFTVGNGSTVNTNTENYVAYCFAPVAGYSAFGSYTGNGSSDGPFVYTGFRPRFILIKRTDTTSQWAIKDTSRDTYNVATQSLFPNLSNAEESNRNVDILSNGFKWRDTSTDSNTSGGTYIWAAFAENPFKISRAR